MSPPGSPARRPLIIHGAEVLRVVPEDAKPAAAADTADDDEDRPAHLCVRSSVRVREIIFVCV